MKNNKKNIYFFEAENTFQLFEKLKMWQDENEKRFLSVNVVKEGEKICCIALTNPTEVVITNEYGSETVNVYAGHLQVDPCTAHNI
jgi:hypothetical protein